MIFKQLHALKGSTASEELVGELCLIFVAAIAIDLLMSISVFIYEEIRTKLTAKRQLAGKQQKESYRTNPF